jgi:hypothetical protein
LFVVRITHCLVGSSLTIHGPSISVPTFIVYLPCCGTHLSIRSSRGRGFTRPVKFSQSKKGFWQA